MADNNNGSAAGASEQGSGVHIQVVGQYIKDLSFENPNVDKLIDGPGENPNLQVEVNVSAQRVNTDVYESSINFKAVAANSKVGTIYDLEVVYAGMFKVQNMPEESLEPFLLINCPTLLFPFLRRLVADLSREGGFPPLLLDPIDFGGLYMSRKQQAAKEAGKSLS